MKIDRLYSEPDRPAVEQVRWKTVPSRIAEPDGRVVFEMDTVEVPGTWSQRATDVLAQKYLRKAGVPSDTVPCATIGVDFHMPTWLHPKKPFESASTGGETSARQVFGRMCGHWTYWAWRSGLVDAEDDARAFYDELFVMLALQVAAPNSPQWFNTGLWWAYGIAGADSGQWVCDDGTPRRVAGSYERPQPHACFLTPLEDDLVNPGGIFDRALVEARIFKHGSGSGMNVSRLRGPTESLSGGGKASGARSFLRVHDAGAGATKSGGTTRRAAKMVVMEMDHPEIREFVSWKVVEDIKAAAMYVGSAAINRSAGEGTIDDLIPSALADRIGADFPIPVFGIGWQGEAVASVDGQNSNNSVRPTDAFMRAVDEGAPWDLTARTTGETVATVCADDLWREVCRAAWACGDPGVLYHDTINAWHTTAADGPIRTTNPCAEFHSNDGNACNLASLRLTAFLKRNSFHELIGPLELDFYAYEHACRLWTIALDCSSSMASFPAAEFALGNFNYRTLGLGYADLGGLLARLDLRYDSNEGRALAAGLTALMTGVAYRTSTEMAATAGAFPRWEINEDHMRRVLRNHAASAIGAISQHEELNVEPYSAVDVLGIHQLCGKLSPLWDRVHSTWAELPEAPSFRNAQVTLVAPTGTISIVMDCATSGVEPFFAPRATKSLAGGGEFSYEYDVRPEDCAMHLDPMAHVLMVAAVTPFLSGAASKTFNMPRSATPEDVDRVYREAHRLGVKAIAIYRDGSKLTQPINVSPVVDAVGNVAPIRSSAPRMVGAPRREHLPWRREDCYTQKVKIAGHSVFLHVSRYPDGRPGEVYLELANEGSTLRAMANHLAISISLGLQHGVPLSQYVDNLLNTRFEPAGIVEGHARIKACSSIGDYLARELGITFLGRDELAHVTPDVDPATGGRLVALDRRAVGVASGYSGDVCSLCGNATMRRAGTCLVCETCGETTGCG